MSHDRFVSVIMPVYNAERFLATAIESVLAQDYKKFELIILNDGSTDKSHVIAQRYAGSVKYYKGANQGSSTARNQAMSYATGDLIAFCDANDIARHHRLSAQVKAFRKDANLDICFGHVCEFKDTGLDTKLPEPEAAPKIEGCCVGAMMVKKASFDKAGLFDDALKSAYFMKWYMKAKDTGLKDQMLEDVLIYRRVHTANQGTRNPEFVTPEVTQDLKAALDRRRAKQQRSDETAS